MRLRACNAVCGSVSCYALAMQCAVLRRRVPCYQRGGSASGQELYERSYLLHSCYALSGADIDDRPTRSLWISAIVLRVRYAGYPVSIAKGCPVLAQIMLTATQSLRSVLYWHTLCYHTTSS
eukprot:2582909-Rhodomonas_salina.2